MSDLDGAVGALIMTVPLKVVLDKTASRKEQRRSTTMKIKTEF